MLQVKVFHVDKTKMILHKRIFSAQNSYYFFLERRDILWRWMQISWRQNKQKEKMNQKMKGIFAQFQKINGINKAVIHHNRFKVWWIKVTCHPIYSKTFRMLNFINKRVKTAVVVAVIAKINNKKVGIKLIQETYLEPPQISAMELCCQKD